MFIWLKKKQKLKNIFINRLYHVKILLHFEHNSNKLSPVEVYKYLTTQNTANILFQIRLNAKGGKGTFELAQTSRYCNS